MDAKIMAVDIYNAQVTGGVGDAPPRLLGCGPRPVRDRAYGVSFDIHYGCPIIYEGAGTLKIGTCPGYKNGIMIWRR